MANPFLFTDDEPVAETASFEPASNPFFTGGDEADELQFQADNPFMCAEGNPFAVTGELDGQLNGQNIFGDHGDSNNFFSDTGTNDKENLYNDTNIIANNVMFETKPEPPKKPPPPRPTPPNQVAQDLISTLTDQLDLTSTKLLGQIPVTRTPSPVSMRDLHSPSPTPDMQIDDLLEIDDENPFMSQQQEQQQQHQEEPPKQEEDMLDFLGDSTAPKKPPPPKSNQDILSLFASPAKAPENKQPDLLCDDNIMDAPTEMTSQPEQTPQTVEEQQELQDIFSAPIEQQEPVEIWQQPEPEVQQSEPETQMWQQSEPETQMWEQPEPEIIHPEPETQMWEQPEPEIQQVPEPETQMWQPEPIEPQTQEQTETQHQPADEEQSYYDTSVPQVQLETEAIPQITYDYQEPANINPHELYVGAAIEPYVSSADISEIATPFSPSMRSDDPSSDPISENPFMEAPSSHLAPEPDAFDAFSAKFEESKSKRNSLTNSFIGTTDGTAWGDDGAGGGSGGFEADGGFGFDADDNFGAMNIEPPEEPDSDEEKEFKIQIRAKADGADAGGWGGVAPSLAPPPKPPAMVYHDTYSEAPIANPFESSAPSLDLSKTEPRLPRTDSQESACTPLFDEDVSQPLEEFPRIHYTGTGWEMQLRSPKQKKITGQRFWKKIFVRLVYQNDTPVVQLFNQPTEKDPFQELPLQPIYSVSEIGAQQYDQYGKIFTIKLQYVFYKERPGVRPGQMSKAERITNKLGKFAAYAIQGDYEGVKELGSDLKKLGLPVEHAPQVSQLLKVGSMNFEDLKQFSMCVEEALFKMPIGRERSMTYKTEEIQVTAVDEVYAESDADGHVGKQIARVRLFVLAFLTGMPTIELGVNDIWRQGREVVGRHDIIPVATEEWIRLEQVEFHSCVQVDDYEKNNRLIRFKPPDACYIELMRFRVRPPKNRELPLQLKAQWVCMGKKIELRADVLVPGFASRKLGQIPCEDVCIRIPIPEVWIYLFRVEKHFRYGSVKSAHRRTGKVKGIERILGAVETLQESLIEVTSGQAKYEHHHRALVWRCPRLPKEGQGAYTTHQLVCRLALTSFDQMPEELAKTAYVEFTMPATQVSHMTVRSVSVQDSDSDEPPEKYVRHLARHEYTVGIERTSGDPLNPYLAATASKPLTVPEEPEPVRTPSAAPSDSDYDST